MKTEADLLIRNSDYLDPEFELSEGKSILIRDGKIEAVDTAERLEEKYTWKEEMDGSGCIYMPGLVDSHMHTGQQLLRGNVLDEMPMIWTRIMLPYESTLTPERMRLSARMAVDYLLDCGHRKIAVMGGRREVDDGIGQRYRGVLQSFEARSLAFDERLYVESHFTMGCAYERALAFVRSGLECTAMFCMSDTMAIGAIKAFSEFGLRVPDDISVIGFDNIALARFLTPTLSTVSQPAQLIAEKSVELISRLIHDPSDTENVIVPSRLVQGGTVRRLGGQEPPTRESARESA